MSRRVELANELLENSMVTQTIQQRPFTMVELITEYEEQTYKIYGFTKVCYPDEWDDEYGVVLAKEKAAFGLAKQIIANEALISQD